MKKALITGILGQDGAYLSRFLLDMGYRVVGADRSKSKDDRWRFERLGILADVEFVDLDLLDSKSIAVTLEKTRPDEIYNFAAQSSVAKSFEIPLETADITGMSVLRLLEELRRLKFQSRFYQASTSEMFGMTPGEPLTEKSRFLPRSPYAFSKAFAYRAVTNYREGYNIFAANGILFNHESPLRDPYYVTRKVTSTVAKISRGEDIALEIGNMSVRRDWGYAKDYVKAMWLMLQQSKPDDYVVSTGKTHSVRDFVELAFSHIGKNVEWEGVGLDEKGVDKKTGNVLVRVLPQFFRPVEVEVTVGDPTKAHDLLGWKSGTTFEELVEIMMEAELHPEKGIF